MHHNSDTEGVRINIYLTSPNWGLPLGLVPPGTAEAKRGQKLQYTIFYRPVSADHQFTKNFTGGKCNGLFLLEQNTRLPVIYPRGKTGYFWGKQRISII